MCRVSESTTAGKRMTGLVIRGWAKVGVPGMPAGEVSLGPSPYKDLQEVLEGRQGQGMWHAGESGEQKGSH